MVGSKKEKRVMQKENPSGKKIVQMNDPDSVYAQNPSWRFSFADPEQWSITRDRKSVV